MDKGAKLLAIILLILVISLHFIYKTERIQEGNAHRQPSMSMPKKDSIKTDTGKINKPEIYDPKQAGDTTAVRYYKDLSYTYNFKILDKFLEYNRQHNIRPEASRIVKIYTKTDSLIQVIDTHPFWLHQDREDLSRSYTTGKNIKLPIVDDDQGEIVVADLNFDGLDDFGVSVAFGADNGDHYAYYIQQPNHKFKFNRYLTDEVMWFPYKFDTIQKTFTRRPFTTFKYDTIKQNWRIIKKVLFDSQGKRIK